MLWLRLNATIAYGSQKIKLYNTQGVNTQRGALRTEWANSVGISQGKVWQSARQSRRGTLVHPSPI